MNTRIHCILVQLSAPEAKAVARYMRRKAGQERPKGTFDKANRFWPDVSENLTGHHRTPSRAWPYSLWRACHTLRHCAHKENADLRAAQRLHRVLSLLPQGATQAEIDTAIAAALPKASAPVEPTP